MAKKKKKAKPRGGGPRAAAEPTEEARDELLALRAIYGEDLCELEHGAGYSLPVVPHPGMAESNRISVVLVFRCEAIAKARWRSRPDTARGRRTGE